MAQNLDRKEFEITKKGYDFKVVDKITGSWVEVNLYGYIMCQSVYEDINIYSAMLFLNSNRVKK